MAALEALLETPVALREAEVPEEVADLELAPAPLVTV